MNRTAGWFVLTASTPSGDLLDLVAEGLFALGASSVLEEGDARTAYLAAVDDPERMLEAARSSIVERLPESTPLRLDWRWQADEDWAVLWKQGLQPRHVTARLVVKPTWTAWDAGPDQVVIDLDPQMAFGTGEHATTRGCLRLLDASIRTGDRVLDVGSGSGILSIAAARLGASGVVAIEHDPDANLNARENLELNGVSSRVRVVEALASPEQLSDFGAFDLILANILSSVIRPLLPTFRAILRPGGRLILGGILRSEHAAVVDDAIRVGLRVEGIDEEEEWWSALLTERAHPKTQPEVNDGG